MIWCTSTWLVYCMSIWLAWLLLAWCSHGHCDIINEVIVIYGGSRVLIVAPRVVNSGPRVPGNVGCFECFCKEYI